MKKQLVRVQIIDISISVPGFASDVSKVKIKRKPGELEPELYACQGQQY